MNYAKFSSEYGDFTVPVFVLNVEKPAAYPTGQLVIYANLDDAAFNSVTWSDAAYISGIMGTLGIPVSANEYENPFVYSSSTPQTALTRYGNDNLLSWIGESFKDLMPEPSDDSTNFFAIITFANSDNESLFVTLDRYSGETPYRLRGYNVAGNTFTIGDLQTEPIILSAKTIEGVVIEPNESYIYRIAKPEYLRERMWLRCKLKYDDDSISERYLSADEITITADSNTVTNLSWINSPVDYGELNEGSLQIEFDRAEEQPSFYLTVTLNSDTNISTTHLVYSIRAQSSFQGQYTPGIGGGIPSGPSGGGGNFGTVNGTPETSVPISPSLPGLGGIGGSTGSAEGSIGNAGMFVHYAMNSTTLKIVGEWLWTDNLGLLVAKEVMSILYGSPIESAISLMSYPFDIRTLPGISITNQNLYWGAHDIGYQAPAITDPYATIDWGTIQLTEFWGNFLDYAPHTKLELYLPWCTGFVAIDPNECLPGTLRVVTNIELAKGTCLHNIIGNDERVIATHSGTCGKQLPLTALDTSGKALALVTGAVASGAVLAGAAAGATMGALDRGTTPVTYYNTAAPLNVRYGLMKNPIEASNIIEGAKQGGEHMAKASKKPAISAAAAALRGSVNVQRNGSFTGSTAGLGVQFPYLVLSRPTQSVPSQYGHHYGYPSNIFASLYNLKGYTEIGEIHLNGIPATDSELNELDSILKGGVIL